MAEKKEPESFYVPKSVKLPEAPDMSAKGIQPQRENPFILDDFRGIEAYTPTSTP